MSEQELDEPNIVITAGVEEDPETVTGEPVDEAQVLGDAVHLADPAEHQEVA
ncbi:hypothetical protein [Micromonospora sp. DT227]|uniref:hypothetical protein n=1 Tax=Micromonospora sp. DT227 TaxID=3393433 RepID=UPI003CF9EA35